MPETPIKSERRLRSHGPMKEEIKTEIDAPIFKEETTIPEEKLSDMIPEDTPCNTISPEKLPETIPKEVSSDRVPEDTLCNAIPEEKPSETLFQKISEFVQPDIEDIAETFETKIHSAECMSYIVEPATPIPKCKAENVETKWLSGDLEVQRIVQLAMEFQLLPDRSNSKPSDVKIETEQDGIDKNLAVQILNIPPTTNEAQTRSQYK